MNSSLTGYNGGYFMNSTEYNTEVTLVQVILIHIMKSQGYNITVSRRCASNQTPMKGDRV